ncbi:MAG: phosphate transport system protein [Actinomycetota bacterium]|jgi:phosphate transport system protein
MTEIETIDAGVQRLFRLVADGLEHATDAFVRGDRRLAASVVAFDPEIDLLHRDVEDLAQALLMSRETLTDTEMRFLLCVLRVAPELERSADLVEHIALRTGALTACLPDDARLLIANMGRYATAMWRTAGEAWIARDWLLLEELCACDDAIDDLHVLFVDRLSSLSLTTADAIELGLVGRFFERLGDHAVNVTRRLRFLTPVLVPAV